jgi:hypothetical protein
LSGQYFFGSEVSEDKAHHATVAIEELQQGECVTAKRKNALFSFHPGLLTGRQQRARGRVPYNGRVAGMLRRARKHKYSFLDDGPIVKPGRGVSSVVHDVALALKGQGYSAQAAKKAAQSASGSDFESLFRSALSRARGQNPMAKKKKKKKSRKGKMPAGLRRYWANKRKKKAKAKRNPGRRRSAPRPKVIVRTRTRTKTVIRYRAAKNPRRKSKTIRAPFPMTPGQLKKFQRVASRLSGMRTRIVRK